MKKLFSTMAVSTLALGLFAPVQTNSVQAASPVLLEEDFDDIANGRLPDGWKLLEGQGAVQDGKLVLNSSATSKPARVVVPLEENEGDYVFEADVTFQSAVEDKRWASLMYRIQNENYPYYQFAVRRGASDVNGLEFAERTPADKWLVPERNFYTENMEYGKTYRLKVVASGNRVQQYVNGQLVIDTDQAGKYLNGDVGFQTSGSKVEYDNVKLTSFEGELPPVDGEGALLPQEAQTSMINAPTIINGEGVDVPHDETASALIKVDGDAGNLKGNGKDLRSVLMTLKGKKIPVLHMEKGGLEKSVVGLLNDLSISDVHVVSSQTGIIEAMKDLNPRIRGGLYYDQRHLNKHDLKKIVQDVHKSESKMVMIPQNVLTEEGMYYLHNRMVAVWGVGGDTMASTHELIHLGVDGIVTNAPELAVKAFGQYPDQTIVQRPMVAAHRGVPSLAPENTMAGYRLAYELGADQIETDVQRTKDGHLVVIHDETVDRTTNGTGAVKDLTLAEIRALDAGIKFDEKFAGEKVPTFKEYLQEFKGKNVMLLVELKAHDVEEQTIQEIKEEGMMDQVVLQSFYLDSMQRSNELAPELPGGYLFSSAVPGTLQEKLKNAKKLVDYGTINDVTLNSSYGSLYKEFIQYMRQRGMLSMHWTFRAEPPFADKLKDGLIGPITDYTQWLTESPVQLEIPIKKVNLKAGKTRTIHAKARVSYRVAEREKIETELFVAEGNGVVTVNGNTVEAIAPGTAQVFAKHTFTMLGEEWNVVSEPIEVTVK
ncbi:glycerophosphodiester phosphodiesterase family protein [Rossellomorea marisflavi]|uniref:glycerophosphodiester phosphodiesterase family protein n=1 Tax=Rossellomorea marisflavi TaxID=189381 RepID=UPI00345DF247